ncbi:SPW repeat protein [Streptomyces sp. NPDC002055]|uniref:SPW repeat protein n=1 Tax=Streptomyces sp. NPDC002055 TaxID=3154534 RepID=UPI00332ACF06
MADLSHRPGDLSGHPDVHEMRDRYARMLQGPDAGALDGLAFLAGVYCAISPWVVHFTGAEPELTLNNLVLGIAVALLGIGLAVAPERIGGMSWAMAAMGVWLIISPWVVTRFPDTGMIWNNVIVGAVVCLLGLLAAGAVMRTMRSQSRTA